MTMKSRSIHTLGVIRRTAPSFPMPRGRSRSQLDSFDISLRIHWPHPFIYPPTHPFICLLEVTRLLCLSSYPMHVSPYPLLQRLPAILKLLPSLRHLNPCMSFRKIPPHLDRDQHAPQQVAG
jgi:hypothetical protein